MAIYINGMEMPKACYECCMYEADIYYCAAAERDIDIPSSDEGRCSFCPLVPVQPHGRLIDADAIRADIDEKRPGRSYEDVWALTVLDNAPTIIPAEEGER